MHNLLKKNIAATRKKRLCTDRSDFFRIKRRVAGLTGFRVNSLFSYMDEKFLVVENLALQSGGKSLLSGVSFTMIRGEQWAIFGRSGTGKTMLAEALAGKHFYQGNVAYFFPMKKNGKNSIQLVTQQHRFRNLSNTSDLYYQQRFNSYDAEQTMTVMEELRLHFDDEYFLGSAWIDELQVRKLLNEPLIQLSNGENKRLQLVMALLSFPELLILDSPFAGLDPEGRETLRRIIGVISKKGIQVLMVTTPKEIPDAISRVAVIENGTLRVLDGRGALSIEEADRGENLLSPDLLEQLKIERNNTFDSLINMKSVHVEYGGRSILKNINWTVRKGECWSLSGPNGAGKSTLLSLITADNPQAYANQIWLFDKRRGTGESIWDIKEKIGFVSPELHLYFDRSATCFEVIASGLFETIGLFRQLSSGQKQKVSQWLTLFKLENVGSKRLGQLSISEQRRTLLARGLIKMPPLLILDEPCQGLDDGEIAHFTRMVDQICRAFGTTLIYVSHYPDQLPDCIDLFLHLQNGEIA
jgi:molybdate transport system ATP-binding protein